jgi:hypothetical protein
MVWVIRAPVDGCCASWKATRIEDEGRYDVSQGSLWAVEWRKPSWFQSDVGGRQINMNFQFAMDESLFRKSCRLFG